MKCKIRINQLEYIVQQLRKYPFTEKMLICQECSTKLMKMTHLDILNTPNAVYPWELEVFAELSLFADSPNATCSFKRSNIEFVNMVNKIRNYQPPYLKKQTNIDFVNAFVMVTGLQQFKVQENIFDRLYRYNYFWTFVNNTINMPEAFSSYFSGLKYTDFRNLALLIFFYASLDYPTAPIIRTLTLKNKNVVDFLKITRKDYQKKQYEKIDDNFENTIFGFNYLRPYPFIEFNGFVFLPLPYLILDAVTESLLTRVTMDDNSLREKIGKEVAQTYIEKIFNESNVYDEVLPECTYYINKKKIDSPDILIKKDDLFCFIDTKLSTPKLEIRKFNKEAIEDTISRYAKNAIQIYNRVKEFNEGLYYPFEEKVSIDSSNTFGIVALLEDSYISRRQIYEKVFSMLEMNDDCEEAGYIKSHIKITNFRDLELFAFRSHDIFVSLNEKKNNPKDWNDMGLFDESLYKNDAYEVLPSLNNFIEMSRNVFLESVDEFVKLGLIQKSSKS